MIHDVGQDSLGNKKKTDRGSQGDKISPGEQYTVDIVGTTGTVSASVFYDGSGIYRVEYTPMKAGSYVVHVRTGGNDIYCGLGEINRCSPFDLTVAPGPTLPSMCEAQSSTIGFDSLIEVVAGKTGTIILQAKDTFGNNRQVGGDIVSISFTNLNNGNIQYRGSVHDNSNGSYTLSYSIPIAGQYDVSMTLEGKQVQYCVGGYTQYPYEREFDGIHVYISPSFCHDKLGQPLTVIHGDLYSLASTAMEQGGSTGLSHGIVGLESDFVIQARDQFGNLRIGSSTANFSAFGDGSSDEFFVTINGPGGYTINTSTNIFVIENSNKNVKAYFRLKIGLSITPELPYSITEKAMQVVIAGLEDVFKNVEVTRFELSDKYVWNITFLNELKDRSIEIFGQRGVSAEIPKFLSLRKLSESGEYPVRYTPWVKGLYELSIRSSGQLFESSYTIEVKDYGSLIHSYGHCFVSFSLV